MMHEKFLTIIVPTYNRRQSLVKGLEALIPQVKSHKDYVSLYVSDNCSNDGTQEIVEELQSRHPGLIGYKRLASNLGAQGNFRDAVKSVDSRYAVIFSDDDIALPSFVDTVLGILRANPDVALINYNALMVSEGGNFIGVRDSVACGGRPKRYEEGGEFIKEHTSVPSLVSSNTFLREDFIREFDTINVGDYPGYEWFAALLKSIVHKPCVYVDLPLFIMSCPAHQRWESNAPWYSAYGLAKLFRDLDNEYAGMLDAYAEIWPARCEKTVLNLIAKYQPLYRERYETLMHYSVSDSFSRKLKFYVFHSARYRRIRLDLLPRIARRLGLGALLKI